MEKIGILMLKTFFPRIIGDIGNLDTFEFPVKRVIVNNATSKNVVKTSDNNLIDDFIREAGIKMGNFDNVAACGYAIPSHWDIGKVYKRLIKSVAECEKIEVTDALIKVYNSFISSKIDDYNSSMYYENPSYLLECYLENKVI